MSPKRIQRVVPRLAATGKPVSIATFCKEDAVVQFLDRIQTRKIELFEFASSAIEKS